FSNYTARIMYAGALGEQDGREVAFINETLQTRLLQPANYNSFNSFNQYSTFVEQPRIGGNVQALTGSYDSNAVLAETFGALPDQNLSFQAAYFDSETDGWNDIYNADITAVSSILKWDVGLRDSFLLTFDDFDRDRRGNPLRRFEADFEADPNQFDEFELTQFELGYRHNFRPGTDLLAYLSYADQEVTDGFRDSTFISAPPIANVTFLDIQEQKRNQDFWLAQLQGNMLTDKHRIIAGTSHYFGDNDVKRQDRIVQITELLIPGIVDVTDTLNEAASRDDDRSFHSAYIQDTWSVTDSLDITGGLYYERLENSEPLVDDDWDTDGWNPRFGVVYRASDRDTIRLAALKYIAPFFSPQISPTELAGLTIYRNYREATEVDNAELAWERAWGTGFTAVSAFWSEGESEVRIVPNVPFGDENRFVDINEANFDNRLAGGEAEINQLIYDYWGIVGRYLYADVENEAFPDLDRREHRITVELNYIHPSGFSTELVQGFRSLNFDDGTERETIFYTNLGLQYRTPNRILTTAVVVRNIFDQEFNWVTDQFTLDGEIPDRNIFGSIEVSF
ncbi:MAG: TonB-dependent receptor domain-containing protein, partial [Gammaproteobacteria bacterium]